MKRDWTKGRFSEIFDLQMGKTPSRDNPRYWNGNNVWVSISDLKGKYVDSAKENITDEAINESGIYKVLKGTVIMSFKLTVGRAAIANCNLYTNEAIMSFIPKQKGQILSAYLYYYLKGYKWIGANNAVMGHTLNKKSISENIFAFPPLPIQEQIVSELDKVSEIIAKKKQQLEELDKLAQSIFYDMFGDPVENEKGWEVKRLEDVCVSKKEIKRAAKSFSKDDDIQYIDISSIDNINNVMTSTTRYIFGEAPSRAQQVVSYNDILISLVRPNLNNVAIVSMDEPNLVASSGFCVLRATKKISKEFLFFSVKMKCFVDYLMQRVSGANYPAVREEDIMSYETVIPSLSLQQTFVKKIEAIEKQKELINQSIKETQTLFNARMDYYFGE